MGLLTLSGSIPTFFLDLSPLLVLNYPASLLSIVSGIEPADLGDVPNSRSHDDIHRLNRKPAGPNHRYRFQPQFLGRIDEFCLGRLYEAGDNVDEISKIFGLFLTLE